MFKKLKDKLFNKQEVMYRNPLYNGKIRNDPCICNSGKKIKNCHGAKYALNKEEVEENSEMINKFLKVVQGGK